MKKFDRKTLALMLALSISAGMTVPAAAYNATDAANKSEALQTLNLLTDAASDGKLGDSLTRMDALSLIMRLAGLESQAFWGDETSHPFTDLPSDEDIDNLVGYAYENGLVKGSSATEFSPNEEVTAQMFVTFTLRALGYDDTNNAIWNNWEKLGKQAGLLNGVNTSDFNLGDAIVVSFAALGSDLKNENMTLSDRLVENYLISDLSLSIAEIITGKTVTKNSSLIDIMGAMYSNVKDGIPANRLNTTEITSDNLSYFLGVDKLDFVEGLACEPMMMAQAHSVCLIRVKDGTDVEQVKKDIRAKVDPRKWICVGVDEENIYVENIGNLILLVMDNSNPTGLVEGFKKLDK